MSVLFHAGEIVHFSSTYRELIPQIVCSYLAVTRTLVLLIASMDMFHACKLMITDDHTKHFPHHAPCFFQLFHQLKTYWLDVEEEIIHPSFKADSNRCNHNLFQFCNILPISIDLGAILCCF